MAQRQGPRSKTSLTLTYHVDGLKEVLRAFNQLPKDATKRLRDRAQQIARELAGDVQSAGQAQGGQAAIVADTVKARRDRVPVITVGGTKAIGRHRVPAYKLLFASEFGMDARTGWYARPRYAGSGGQQYQPHIGRDSYWIFKTVDEKSDRVLTEWGKVAEDVINDFTRGG